MDVRKRAMALAKELRLKFRTASLSLQACGEAERVAKSREQVDSLYQLISGAVNRLKSAEVDNMVDLVTAAEGGGWQDVDRLQLLRALEGACAKRRDEQKWTGEVLNIFTKEEWDRWVAAGPARMETTLVEMTAGLKSLDAKNPCEHTKIFWTAIWLHLRGDGVNLHSTMRNCAKEMVKRKLTQHLKTFRPDVYIERLNLDELRGIAQSFTPRLTLAPILARSLVETKLL